MLSKHACHKRAPLIYGVGCAMHSAQVQRSKKKFRRQQCTHMEKIIFTDRIPYFHSTVQIMVQDRAPYSNPCSNGYGFFTGRDATRGSSPQVKKIQRVKSGRVREGSMYNGSGGVGSGGFQNHGSGRVTNPTRPNPTSEEGPHP